MRRILCVMAAIMLLAAMLSQTGLAISGQEALFGSDAPAESTGGAASAGSDNTSYPTLRPGDRDGDDSTAYIVFMQNRLIELGYLGDSANGTYGENTEKAVLAFQRNNNLPETGVADSETQRKLYSDISTLVLSTSEDTDFGGDLTRIQTILGLWGFYGGKIDGLTGSGTSNAIRDFKHYMLILDPAYGTTPTPAPTSTPNPEGKFSDMPVIMDRPLVDQAELDRTNDTIT
ncbi:MAG: peptidoglycan-binding protein, partial [Oscillospiraceae bacterium]|nr:peptidoglycan-binding protein [Oscillospiraceae bacterium]